MREAPVALSSSRGLPQHILALSARGSWTMGNKRGQLVGTQRGNRQRFPYEPVLIGGKLVMPAELQRVHRAILAGGALTDEMRAIAAKSWPHLVTKLPPAAK